MKKILSIIKIIGMTTLVVAVILKSLFLLHILGTVPFGSNIMLVFGILLLALNYFLIAFENSKKIFQFAFNLLFSLFLFGSLFFFMHWPGGTTVLLLSISFIPLLILFLIFGKINVDKSNVYIEELLWVVAIIFVMLFFLISWIIHFSSLVPQHH